MEANVGFAAPIRSLWRSQNRGLSLLQGCPALVGIGRSYVALAIGLQRGFVRPVVHRRPLISQLSNSVCQTHFKSKPRTHAPNAPHTRQTIHIAAFISHCDHSEADLLLRDSLVRAGQRPVSIEHRSVHRAVATGASRVKEALQNVQSDIQNRLGTHPTGELACCATLASWA